MSARAFLAAWTFVYATFLSVGALAANELHVSPSGAPGSNGSLSAPLSLAAALSSSSPARPGDTVWLHNGVYRGTFVSQIAGTASAPIVVRQAPGERATIDSAPSPGAALTVTGGWTWFWGFEITSSDPLRVSSQTGSWPTDIRRGYGVVVRAPGVQLINLIVHDLSTGIGLDDWQVAENSGAHGNVVYNNGWQAPDRAHGHGFYVQNRLGTRVVGDNIIFNNFSHGVQAYGSETAYVDNITLEGNIVFNNGSVSANGFERDLLIGGGRVAQMPKVLDNSTYGGSQTMLGYAGCAGGEVRRNYLVGASPLLLTACAPVVQENTLYSTYHYSFGELPGQYPQNTYLTTAPTGVVVRVRPNKYEVGRAQVAVYNWARQGQVALDLNGIGLQAGDRFEVRNAQDFYGATVVTGTYTGAAVSVPMTNLTVALPVGNVPNFPATTAPEFAALVVIRLESGAPPTPAAPSAPTGLHISSSAPVGGDGSAGRPLTLAAALSSSSPARPGDTLWLHGGVYRGSFVSQIAGTAGAPIVVRQVPGERATIDSAPSANTALTVTGGWTWFWGFEITSSDPLRVSSQTGPWPTDIRRGYGVVVRAPGVQLINLVVHDLSTGLGLDDWQVAENSGAYGNVVYNNGWQAPGQAYGHGMYVQNGLGTRLLADNIIFNNFSHGVQAYGSATAHLDNITLEGNIVFNNGSVSANGFERDLLIGGGRAAQMPKVLDNSTYGGSQTMLGYAGCTGGEVRRNYLVGASPLLLASCAPVVQENTLYSTYHYSFGELPERYPQNTYLTTAPTGVIVRVRPNKYEVGRAQVAVYNWARQREVAVDLKGTGLRAGDRFEVRNAQDFYGAAVVTGTYTETPVSVPMTNLTLAPPVGNIPRFPASTAPEFAAFVVLRVS